jgi:hypothetical protein
LGLPPSMIATQEFVVPRSMPIILPMNENPLKNRTTDRYLGTPPLIFNCQGAGGA